MNNNKIVIYSIFKIWFVNSQNINKIVYLIFFVNVYFDSWFYSLKIFLAEQKLERLILHERCQKLKTDNFDLKKTAEKLSRRVSVSDS